MCLSKNERGGPKRCSAHARAEYQSATDALAGAEARLGEAEQSLSATRSDINSLYTEIGRERNPFYDVLDDERRFEGMTDQQREDLVALEAREVSLSDAYMAAFTEAETAREAHEAAEDKYFHTREGVGVLAARIDTQLLDFACENNPEKKLSLKHDVMRTIRRLAETEQEMIDEQWDREQRWGTTTPQLPVRGARLGLENHDQAALVVVAGSITGSYTNTRRADPDAQADAESAPHGGATLRCTRMSLTRRMADGSRRELVVPIEEASDDDAGAPPVTSALRTAVRSAEGYDEDYSRWARAHGYAQHPDSPWQGSTSYREGRRAHDAAGKVRDRVLKFLDANEYQLLLSREARESVS
ncbi:hypothetical protein [Gordonia alkanivorans]|uniref:hypothetical protein n=1 Tax=Gordonia alkanivorans TaxID=84096 RepID=UPI0004BAE6BA|nr:hypothetical protein [Gordonia alkanivorans]